MTATRRQSALTLLFHVLGHRPKTVYAHKDVSLPKGVLRLGEDRRRWPERLTSPVGVLLPEGSTRTQRESLVLALAERMAPGEILAFYATDLSSEVMLDLLVHHFEPKADASGVCTGIRREKDKPKALLLFPPVVAPIPIELFSVQPTALLRLSTWLKTQGVHVVFHSMLHLKSFEEYSRLLFLDKAERAVAEMGLRPVSELRCGNFEEEKRSKPAYWFGENIEELRAFLATQHFIERVYISSVFTYHYVGTHAVVAELRRELPEAKISLGGIYPSLCPEHAKTSGADDIHIGPFEPINFAPLDFSVFEASQTPDFAVIKITRGCPFDCSFCSVHLLEGHKVLLRPEEEVLDEMRRLSVDYGVSTFILWESNLLIQKGYFEHVLDRIQQVGLNVRFILPEGLMPALITPELVDKMVDTGLMDVLSLPLETAYEDVLKDRFGKRNKLDDIVRATKLLHARKVHVVWFVLIGYAGQTLTQALRSILFTWRHDTFAKLLSFTPIPQTREFELAQPLIAGKDLAELGPDCHSLASRDFRVGEMEELGRLFNETCYHYEEILRGDGQIEDAKGVLHRPYNVDDKLEALPHGRLRESIVSAEMRKEAFLQQYTLESLSNPKVLVYHDVPERRLWEDFDEVWLGREVESDDFDFQAAGEMFSAILDQGKRAGLVLPLDFEARREEWLRLAERLANQEGACFVVNGPEAQRALAELLTARRAVAHQEAGRLFLPALSERLSGRLYADCVDDGMVPPGLEAVHADGCAVGRLGPSLKAAGLYYPYALLQVDAVRVTGIERRLDAGRGLALFQRGRAVCLLTPGLGAFQANPGTKILYQYRCPR